MSESYTIGGDTLVKCDNPDWQGQTFRVRENHNLEYIDLELRGVTKFFKPVIQVFHADGNHEPFGPCLSRNRYVVETPWHILITGRVRFSMESYLLTTEYYYVIIVANFPALGAPSTWWQYDTGDATYPRGIRISSSDGGASWTKHHNDDFMFAEFGTPPLPKPDPPPPIQNFAVPDIVYTHWDIGLTIRIPTTVPCHLTCYYTDKEPRKHHRSRIVRGLEVPWATYFCFVAWKEVEQTELGDTLYHTFEFPEWEECQTKWFTFRGEVDLQDSPSVGPIFKHHHPGGLPKLVTLRPNAPGWLCLIPFEVGQPCPDHYLNVNEEIPDEDASKVYTSAPWTGWIYRDFYQIPNLNVGKIKALHHHARIKRVGGYAYVDVIRHYIYTHATEYYYQVPTTTGNWQTLSHTWTLNPFTGEPWTQQELDDLQIGVGLRYYSGVGWAASGHCTQVYAIVERGIEGGPD